jgi:hypothetical protein
MPVMQVIEAQRASILVPHDHLHNNHESTCGAVDGESGRLAMSGRGDRWFVDPDVIDQHCLRERH